MRLGFEDIAEFLIDQDAETYKEKLPWKNTDEELVKTVYPAVQGGHVKILTTLIKKGNLVCNKSRGKLLKRAVDDNNPSALGFLFSKYYNHLTHSTPPVPDPRMKKASDGEPDWPRLSDIEEALTLANKKNQNLKDEIKAAKYLIRLLTKEPETHEDSAEDDSAKKGALQLAENMKKDCTKKNRNKDSQTAQYIIEVLRESEKHEISSEEHLLHARSS